MKPTQTLTRTFVFILFSLCFILILQSCSTIHIYQAGSNRDRPEGNNPGTDWQSKRVNTFLWGAIRQDVIIKDCREGDGKRLNIEEVKIDKNFPSTLASIITIGLWEPTKVSWRCARPITQDSIPEID